MEPAEILKFADSKGEFKRQVSSFRNFISKGSSKFPAEANRYVLYISYACPWAHRTLLVRNMLGLEGIIALSVVDYLMGEKGWKFSTPAETKNCIPDPVFNSKFLSELYFRAEPNYKGRFTVPVLWDKTNQTIVNNESSEIIRMLPEFVSTPAIDFYPEPKRSEIDQVNDWIYHGLNNGVYKAGFATDQQIYEKECRIVFQTLDRVESILSKSPFLVGDQITEADIRLFTTVIRFDPVYFGHFKCNLKSIEFGYPAILQWVKRIYQMEKVKDTIEMDHIKKHYYMSHKHINPTQVVPLSDGPTLEN